MLKGVTGDCESEESRRQSLSACDAQASCPLLVAGQDSTRHPFGLRLLGGVAGGEGAPAYAMIVHHYELSVHIRLVGQNKSFATMRPGSSGR